MNDTLIALAVTLAVVFLPTLAEAWQTHRRRRLLRWVTRIAREFHWTVGAGGELPFRLRGPGFDLKCDLGKGYVADIHCTLPPDFMALGILEAALERTSRPGDTVHCVGASSRTVTWQFAATRDAKELRAALAAAEARVRDLDGGHSEPIAAVRHFAQRAPDVERFADAIRWLQRADDTEWVDARLADKGQHDNLVWRMAACRLTDAAWTLPVLVDILRHGYDMRLRTEALGALLDHPRLAHGAAPLRRTLEALVSESHGQLLADIVNALHRHFDHTPPLAELAMRLGAVGPVARVALVAAMGRHGEAAEQHLLGALVDGSLAVRLGALDQLYTVGTPRALGAIKARQSASTSEERHWAARALYGIRSRFSGAVQGAGGLSVAEITSGALSPAELAGELSEVSEA